MAGVFYLPRAAEAVIPTHKLVEYALNPEHPRGQHKARVFQSALGIARSDWRYLHDQCSRVWSAFPVRGTRMTPFGVVYDIVLGRRSQRRHAAGDAIWMVEAGSLPRLVSTWVDIP